MFHFVIENLHGHTEGLLQNFSSVLGICIVAEVGSLINEALPLSIDDEPKGIRMFLIELSDCAVTRGRGVQIPRHRMATTPVPMRLGPDVQSHANAVPGVVRDATHLGK